MDEKTARTVMDLHNKIMNKEIEFRHISDSLKKCQTDETLLYWSAHGNLALVNGWGRNDVKRLMDKVGAELADLKELFARL